MLAANVIDKSELPDFDEETGLLPNHDNSGLEGLGLGYRVRNIELINM